jgi:hypothetical protein
MNPINNQSLVRFKPCGVSSNAHARMSAMGKPIASNNNQTDRPIRNFKKRKDLRRNLDEQRGDNALGDRNFVNIAPL